MEHVSKKRVQEMVKQFGSLQQAMVEKLKETGMSEEQFKSLMSEAIPKYMESIFKGENPLEDMIKMPENNLSNEE